jgi:hypothetical protein
MQKRLIIVSLIAVAFARIVVGADVEFKLQTEDPPRLSSPKLAESFTLTMADRVWSVKGIEERCELSDVNILETWNGRTIRVLDPRILAALVSQSPAAPYWIDDDLWPRTKEIFHYRDETPAEKSPTELIRFLGPTTHKNKFYIGPPAFKDRFYVEANCP